MNRTPTSPLHPTTTNRLDLQARRDSIRLMENPNPAPALTMEEVRRLAAESRKRLGIPDTDDSVRLSEKAILLLQPFLEEEEEEQPPEAEPNSREGDSGTKL